jgi:hypothetical protein
MKGYNRGANRGERRPRIHVFAGKNVCKGMYLYDWMVKVGNIGC